VRRISSVRSAGSVERFSAASRMSSSSRMRREPTDLPSRGKPPRFLYRPAVKTVLGRAAQAARGAGLARPLGLGRDLVDRLLLRLGRPPLAAPVGSRRLRGFLRHRSFLAEVELGDYEPTLRKLILESVGSGTLFVDVGAHVGYYSVLSALAGADVIAFEPDPYNYAALVRNVEGLPVDARPAAVADAVGRAVFHTSASTTGSSLLARRDIPLRNAVEVDTTTVDAIVGGRFDRPVVVKLDVEGAEPLALAGAAEVIRHSESLVVIAEVNPSALATRGYTAEDVVRPLSAGDLEVSFVDRRGALSRLPVESVKGNLVARRVRA
jgi:FkbM family methyltransferase